MESSLYHDNPKDANTPHSTNPEYCLSDVVLRSGGGALVCSPLPPTQCVRRTTQGASDVDSFESPTAPSPSLISSPWPVMDSSWFLSFSLHHSLSLSHSRRAAESESQHRPADSDSPMQNSSRLIVTSSLSAAANGTG